MCTVPYQVKTTCTCILAMIGENKDHLSGLELEFDNIVFLSNKDTLVMFHHPPIWDQNTVMEQSCGVGLNCYSAVSGSKDHIQQHRLQTIFHRLICKGSDCFHHVCRQE